MESRVSMLLQRPSGFDGATSSEEAPSSFAPSAVVSAISEPASGIDDKPDPLPLPSWPPLASEKPPDPPRLPPEPPEETELLV